MPVLPFLIATCCILIIAYRYYSAFIAAKVLALDPKRKTPAYTHGDGQNYYPTNKWVLFGHHFAAISGAGPLIGPVLAMQFGFLPGFLWLLIGVVLGGAVHDFVILTASIRHDGKSLSEIAKKEISPLAGICMSIAILFIVVIALAGLGLAVVNALAESAWGTFTIATTIPLAFFMGLYMYKLHGGNDSAIRKASLVGVALLLLSVYLGKDIAHSTLSHYFLFDRRSVTFLIGAYGFLASVLPVWLLLCPRDYLSSYMKLGTIFLLVAAVFFVQPDLRMPPLTQWIHGGGPIIPGKLFPFVFITIACGSISGFHALIASGTTPKMVKSETDARMIGYGAMLLEGLVGIVALIAAASLYPEDYFAINVSAEAFSKLGMTPINLPQLESAVGEQIAGRPGGAVSLAVGIAQIFSSLPWMQKLISYWYHFAIMFEALFILTTIDTGTRVARYLLQESLGSGMQSIGMPLGARFRNPGYIPASLLCSFLVVAGWVHLILTGSISTIWPMFGVANQLLATCALCIGTRFLYRQKKCFWITLLPMIFVGITTLVAAVQSITQIFIPRGAYLNAGLAACLLALAGVVLIEGMRTLRAKT